MYRMATNPDSHQTTKEEILSNGSVQTITSSQSVSARSSSAGNINNSEVIAREIRDGALSSYIGPGTVITGEIAFKGTIRVEGQVGQLSSEGGTVIIGENGKVDGDMNVLSAMISGGVTGNIIASQRVELGPTAKVRGNIQSALLSIEEGALFEGSCRMLPVRKGEGSNSETAISRNTGSAEKDFNAIAANLNAAVGGKPMVLGVAAGNDILG